MIDIARFSESISEKIFAAAKGLPKYLNPKLMDEHLAELGYIASDVPGNRFKFYYNEDTKTVIDTRDKSIFWNPVVHNYRVFLRPEFTDYKFLQAQSNVIINPNQIHILKRQLLESFGFSSQMVVLPEPVIKLEAPIWANAVNLHDDIEDTEYYLFSEAQTMLSTYHQETLDSLKTAKQHWLGDEKN